MKMFSPLCSKIVFLFPLLTTWSLLPITKCTLVAKMLRHKLETMERIPRPAGRHCVELLSGLESPGGRQAGGTPCCCFCCCCYRGVCFKLRHWQSHQSLDGGHFLGGRRCFALLRTGVGGGEGTSQPPAAPVASAIQTLLSLFRYVGQIHRILHTSFDSYINEWGKQSYRPLPKPSKSDCLSVQQQEKRSSLL